MADTSRTINVKIDGDARGLSVAARQAERDIARFRSGVNSASKVVVGLTAASGAAAAGIGIALPAVGALGLAFGIAKAAVSGTSDAVDAYTKALEEGKGDFTEYNKLLAQMSPAQREFTKQIIATRKPLDDLQKVAATAFLPGVTSLLKDSQGLFPVFEKNVRRTGEIMSDTARGLGDLFSTDRFKTNLDKFLQATEPITAQIGDSLTRLIDRVVQFGAQMAPAAKGFATFIGDLTTGVEGFLDALAPHANDFKSIWESLGSIVKTLLPILGELAGQASGVLAPALAGVAGFLKDNAGAIQQLVPAVAGLVLGFKALTVVQSISGWLKPLAGAFDSVGSAAERNGKKLGAPGGKTGFLGRLAGIAGFLGGGGPLGLALAAGGVALGIFATAQANAEQAARDHQSAVDGLKGTLDQFTGQVTDTTVEYLANDFASRKLSDGTTNFRDALSGAGISLRDFSLAASGNEEVLGKVNSQLFVAAQKTPGLQQLYAKWKPRLDEAGVSFDTFTAAAIGNEQAFDELTTKLGVAGSGFEVWRQDLHGAVGALGEVGSVLGDNVAKLKEAAEQTIAAAEASQTFAGTLDLVKDHLDALKGGVQPTAAMAEAFKTLGLSAGTAAQGAGDAAEKFGGVEEGADAARKSMEGSRQAFIDSAVAAGLSKKEAGQLADQIGLIPEVAETIFRTNADETQAQLLLLNHQFEKLPPGKSVVVEALTADAEAKLVATGFTVEHLPNGEIKVTAATGDAETKLQELVRFGSGLITVIKVDANPNPATGKITSTVQLGDGSKATMTLDADPDPATGKIHGTVKLGNGETATITLDGDPDPATGKINGTVTYGNGQTSTITVKASDQATPVIDHVSRGRTVQIQTIALTGAAESALTSLVARWNGRQIYVNIGGGRVTATGAIYTKGMEDGGILGFAGGGLAGRRLTPMSNRIAQVIAPNTWRVIGDRLRGDEFFIPDDDASRSLAIGAEWARRRGFALVPRRYMQMATGGVLGGSQGQMNGPVAMPAPTVVNEIRVYIGEEEITGRVETVVRRMNRELNRTVRAGAGLR